MRCAVPLNSAAALHVGHPENNPRHERMHRTLKARTARPPCPMSCRPMKHWKAFSTRLSGSSCSVRAEFLPGHRFYTRPGIDLRGPLNPNLGGTMRTCSGDFVRSWPRAVQKFQGLFRMSPNVVPRRPTIRPRRRTMVPMNAVSAITCLDELG